MLRALFQLFAPVDDGSEEVSWDWSDLAESVDLLPRPSRLNSSDCFYLFGSDTPKSSFTRSLITE